MFFGSAVGGFFSAPYMIIGGLLGWFSGAGPRSFWSGLLLASLLPILMTCLVIFILRPDGYMYAPQYMWQGFDQWSTLPFLGGSIAGSMMAILMLFFPMSKARGAWRNHKAILESVSK